LKPVYLISFFLLACWAKLSFAQDAIEVELPEEFHQRLGIETESLSSTQQAVTIPALIRVVDPAPLIMLDADLQSAGVASAAAQQNLQRLTRLAGQNQSASQEAVETAQARAATETANLAKLERQMELEWGQAFASMEPDERHNLMLALSKGSASLLRADSSKRPEGILGDLLVQINGADNTPIRVSPLALTPTIEVGMQSIGLYALYRGDQASSLRPGRVVNGSIATNEQLEGIIIPRSAIVLIDGLNWVYIQTDDDEFERRLLLQSTPTPDGWFVSQGFNVGDQLVVSGAESLVGIEYTPADADLD